jgi:hypothetical protein
MVIVVPEGSPNDPTRKAEYDDPAHALLTNIGIPSL